MNLLAEPAPMLADHELAAMAAALMQSRQTILPKRLTAPGPDAAQLELILTVAASAPDHGQLLPWRFVRVPDCARPLLAEAFGQALQERDAAATTEQLAQVGRVLMNQLEAGELHGGSRCDRRYCYGPRLARHGPARSRSVQACTDNTPAAVILC